MRAQDRAFALCGINVMKTETTIEKWENLKNDPLLSIVQIKETFGCSDYTVRRWIGEGKLLATKVGGQYRCRTSRVLKMIVGGE